MDRNLDGNFGITVDRLLTRAAQKPGRAAQKPGRAAQKPGRAAQKPSRDREGAVYKNSENGPAQQNSDIELAPTGTQKGSPPGGA